MFVRPALVALQFLTVFPVRLEAPPAGREVGLSLLWYPAVGLLLGHIVWAAAALLGRLATPLAAAIGVTVWIVCTGGVHLDGLADTADAWAAGRADRERTLAIMKDPHSGPIAVVAIVCVLLLKFGALAALCGARGARGWSDLHLAAGCILPPLLARAAVPLLFAQTPYVRDQGLGAELAQYQSRTAGLWVGSLAGLLVVLVCGRQGIAATVAAALMYMTMRRAFLRRLGGMTGDCVGAMIEVIETATLVTLAVVTDS